MMVVDCVAKYSDWIFAIHHHGGTWICKCYQIFRLEFLQDFFASHHHNGGRMCGCCQMLRLDRKLQWRHPAPAKWDEVRNYTHKTKLHEDAKKMIFFNQGNIFFYLECRHFKYQIFSTKPCGSQEIY